MVSVKFMLMYTYAATTSNHWRAFDLDPLSLLCRLAASVPMHAPRRHENRQFDLFVVTARGRT